MISEDVFNRICQIIWLEEIRICNEVTDRLNYITKYRPSDPEPYIKLAQAQAVKNYFDEYVCRAIRWLNGFVDDS